jgi:hypothetical protein
MLLNSSIAACGNNTSKTAQALITYILRTVFALTKETPDPGPVLEAERRSALHFQQYPWNPNP